MNYFICIRFNINKRYLTTLDSILNFYLDFILFNSSSLQRIVNQ